MVRVKFLNKTELTINEIKEVLNFMECQETTDRLDAGSYHIAGNDATIDIEIDAEGDLII